ncbi:hypothetical protein STASHLEY_00570 [Brevundimonas phage vB_BpoS-StAshley]|nr:hypothetical protein STASHLEY_00570 [Brevundimonas phage vB_BpoS-StAshley]
MASQRRNGPRDMNTGAPQFRSYVDWLLWYPIQELPIEAVKDMVCGQDNIAFEALKDPRNYDTRAVIDETHVANALNNVFCAMLEADNKRRFGSLGESPSPFRR